MRSYVGTYVYLCCSLCPVFASGAETKNELATHTRARNEHEHDTPHARPNGFWWRHEMQDFGVLRALARSIAKPALLLMRLRARARASANASGLRFAGWRPESRRGALAKYNRFYFHANSAGHTRLGRGGGPLIAWRSVLARTATTTSFARALLLSLLLSLIHTCTHSHTLTPAHSKRTKHTRAPSTRHTRSVGMEPQNDVYAAAVDGPGVYMACMRVLWWKAH